MSYLQDQKPVTLFELGKMRAEGRKIAMLTAYDASFAALLGRAGVDSILIGDSLGNVLQGQKSTLPVTVEQMAYHTECVARAGALTCSRSSSAVAVGRLDASASSGGPAGASDTD